MTNKSYKELIEEIGTWERFTQENIAKRLGIRRETLSRRMNGKVKITKEAQCALLYLIHYDKWIDGDVPF